MCTNGPLIEGFIHYEYTLDDVEHLQEAAARGLPLPLDWARKFPYDTVIAMALRIAIWNDRDSTVVEILDALRTMRWFNDEVINFANRFMGDGMQPLAFAALRGSFEAARALLACNADVTLACRPYHGNALYFAASNGDGAMAALLVSARADVNEVSDDYNGTPLLCRAAEIGDTTAVTLLLEMKACVHQECRGGRTPLGHAALHGNVDIVRALVCAKAAVDGGGPNSLTPLGDAIFDSNMLAAQVLIAAGADVNKSRTHTLMKALYLGEPRERRAMVRALLKARADPDRRGKRGATPLFFAVERGRHFCAQALLFAKASANTTIQKDPQPSLSSPRISGTAKLVYRRGTVMCNVGRTPLCRAAANGRVVAVAVLLEAKADVDADFPGRNVTPLSFAAANGHPAVVAVLLEAKADIEAAGPHKAAPLLFAAANRHADVVTMLLNAKADARRSTAPLAFAVCNGGGRRIVPLLVDAKADPAGAACWCEISWDFFNRRPCP
jgi:ankyrin repeat protein